MTTQGMVETWGVYINTQPIYRITPDEFHRRYPSWADIKDESYWQSRGIAIWNNLTEQFVVLWAKQALEVLDWMHGSEEWKVNGILFPKQTKFVRLRLPTEKTSRKKKGGPEDTEQKLPDRVEDVQMSLGPEEAEGLFNFLTAHENLLRKMAEEDQKEESRVWRRVLDVLFAMSHTEEEESIDLSARLLTWEHDPASHKWTCNLPPNRGTVLLSDNKLLWRGCIEQPDQFKSWSPDFLKLDEALGWAEKELISIHDAAQEEKDSEGGEQFEDEKPRVQRISPEKMEQLRPYLLDVSDLEPKRITYQAMIDIEHDPINFKTMEMSFGKKLRYGEVYPSVKQLANDLRFNDSLLDIEDFGVRGWYRATSLETFYQAQAAIDKSREVWGKSSIVEKFKDGPVIRARYGYQEVETSYCVYIGGCEKPDNPWSSQENREDFMANKAMRIALILALDVEGFRAYIDLDSKIISDEELLEKLHERRAKSKYTTAEMRNESIQWLREHGKP